MCNICKCACTCEPKVDWSKPIQTRAGKPARVVCNNKCSPGNRRSRVVLVMDKDGTEYCVMPLDNGRMQVDQEIHNDVINVPPKKVTRYVNIWSDVAGNTSCSAHPYHKEENARRHAEAANRSGGSLFYVAIAVPIEVEEK